MGEPAIPTAAERKATRELAAKIVESVRNDEAMPLPFTTYNTRDVGPAYEPEAVRDFVFMLAQEIELLRADVASWIKTYNQLMRQLPDEGD